MGGWVKRWKCFRTKSADQVANGPVWMPQVLKPLCLIHFSRVPLSHFQPSSLWGNKRWFIMGGWVKRWKHFGKKPARQAENVPLWMPQVLQPLCLIDFSRIPFSHFLPSSLGGNKKWFIMVGWVKKVEKIRDKIILTDWKCSCLNAPGTETTVFHWLFKNSLFPFSFLPLSGVIRDGLLWEAG